MKKFNLSKYSVFLLPFLLLSLSASADLGRGLNAYQQHEYKTAINEFTLSANSGNPNAQVLLGNMYYEGIGTEKNYDIAFELTKTAVENETKPNMLPAVHMNLGLMYLQGRGTAHDSLAAYNLFKLAAKNGNKKARLLLSMMNIKGIAK